MFNGMAHLVNTPEPLAKVILNGVKNLGWGIISYLIDPPPQTLRFAQGDMIGAFCKIVSLLDDVPTTSTAAQVLYL